MKRIVVINTAASSGGALSILNDFYEYIKKNDHKNEWIFILSDNYIEETENIKVIVNKDVKLNWINRLKWEIIYGAKYINNLNPDVVFSMQNTINKGIKAPTMIYLHQSIPFQNVKKFSFIKREERLFAIYQHIIGGLIKSSLRRADKIIVQTEWMKRAVISKTKINKDYVIVSMPTIEIINDRVIEENVDRKSFFYPADYLIYKNHDIIIQCAKNLIKQGIDDFKITFTLDDSYKNELNITKDIENNIKFIGKVSREDVIEKYKSDILLFPSYIETLGMPLLEASMMGGIILASDCEFSREILNEYRNVRYFDPFSINQLTSLMKSSILGEIEFNNIQKYKKNENGWNLVLKQLIEL